MDVSLLTYTATDCTVTFTVTYWQQLFYSTFLQCTHARTPTYNHTPSLLWLFHSIHSSYPFPSSSLLPLLVLSLQEPQWMINGFSQRDIQAENCCVFFLSLICFQNTNQSLSPPGLNRTTQECSLRLSPGYGGEGGGRGEGGGGGVEC